MEQIRLLPKKFEGVGEVRGKLFERVKAFKYVYMYRIGFHGEPGTYYEIFARKVHRQYLTESYPSSKQFGITAFTSLDEKKALKIFKQLQKKEVKKARVALNTKNNDV